VRKIKRKPRKNNEKIINRNPLEKPDFLQGKQRKNAFETLISKTLRKFQEKKAKFLIKTREKQEKKLEFQRYLSLKNFEIREENRRKFLEKSGISSRISPKKGGFPWGVDQKRVFS